MKTFGYWLLMLALFMSVVPAESQQLQIPPTLVANETLVKGGGTVFLQSRKDIQHKGTFEFTVEAAYNPQSDAYASGTVELKIDMSDTMLDGVVTVKVPAGGILQLTSVGKHSPNAFLYARCDFANGKKGYVWMMFADNKPAGSAGTADVVQFVLFDTTGKRIAYACGPLKAGDVTVAPGGI